MVALVGGGGVPVGRAQSQPRKAALCEKEICCFVRQVCMYLLTPLPCPPSCLPAVDPDVGLEIMSRLLHQAASAANVWSWQQALFVGNIFLWDNIVRAMPAVPPFLQEFARERCGPGGGWWSWAGGWVWQVGGLTGLHACKQQP